jgi:hypothetical protein
MLLFRHQTSFLFKQLAATIHAAAVPSHVQEYLAVPIHAKECVAAPSHAKEDLVVFNHAQEVVAVWLFLAKYNCENHGNLCPTLHLVFPHTL